MADLVWERRAERLWRHCLYRIATGKWEPGFRLPSVRDAARQWDVDRRTVLEAFDRLEQSGLVRRAPKSGFFVARDAAEGRVARHRYELARLYEETAARVRRETGLSPLAALRYLAQLAAIRAGDQPECGFVECTMAQAEAHATEIQARLGVPCCGLTVSQLDGRARRVPSHVRTLLVSAFHADDLGQILQQPDPRAVIVPIAVSPALADTVPDHVRDAILLEVDDADAHDIAADVGQILPGVAVRWEPCADLAAGLSEVLGASDPGVVVLLSPRAWGNAPPSVREDPRVRQVEFRVHESAWPAIADAIGLPLGVPGQTGIRGRTLARTGRPPASP